MQTDELSRFVRALRPKLSAEERSVAVEIYKGLAASGAISVAALGERTGLDPSTVETSPAASGSRLRVATHQSKPGRRAASPVGETFPPSAINGEIHGRW